MTTHLFSLRAPELHVPAITSTDITNTHTHPHLSSDCKFSSTFFLFYNPAGVEVLAKRHFAGLFRDLESTVGDGEMDSEI